MLSEPIESRYRKENRMFHSGAFAIAAGVVGLGTAATTGIMGMQAANRAAGATAATGKKMQQQTAKATEGYDKKVRKATRQLEQQQNKLRRQIEAIDPNIYIPRYDLRGATLEGIEAANRVTANTLQQLEQVAPGSAMARQQVGGIINSYLRGEVPQDVREQTMRNIAEMGGAGFNIATAGRGMGIQAPQANLARSLGLTSLNLQQTGINAAQSWQQMANQFIQSPTQMMAFGLQGRAQDINVAQANIENQFRKAGALGDINTQMFGAQTGLAQKLYEAQTGQAQTAYDVGQQNIAARLAASQAQSQAIQGIGSAATGAIMGAGSAYNQAAQARATSTTPMESGFYAGEIGAANAYNVAPSQLSYQKPTGGFLGIGGQKGGFYYTPSGVYGR